MLRRATGPLLALVVTLTLAAACTDDEPDGPNGPARPKTAPIEPGDEYVAIGDSYTAAGGTGRTERQSGCLRSAANYPNLLARRLDLELTDVSCGGADSTHLLESQKTRKGNVPPQIEALSETTDLVTVGMGGNDLDAFAVLVSNCVVVARTDPEGSPCSDYDTQGGGSRTAEAAAQIQERLINSIGYIVAAAPNARIVLVGYPRFAPARGTCEELPLAEGDYAFARRLSEGVQDAIRTAAARTGADFADVYAASRGHDVCSDDPWMAGSKPQFEDAAPYHPFPEEQRAVARIIEDVVTSS